MYVVRIVPDVSGGSCTPGDCMGDILHSTTYSPGVNIRALGMSGDARWIVVFPSGGGFGQLLQIVDDNYFLRNSLYPPDVGFSSTNDSVTTVRMDRQANSLYVLAGDRGCPYNCQGIYTWDLYPSTHDGVIFPDPEPNLSGSGCYQDSDGDQIDNCPDPAPYDPDCDGDGIIDGDDPDLDPPCNGYGGSGEVLAECSETDSCEEEICLQNPESPACVTFCETNDCSEPDGTEIGAFNGLGLFFTMIGQDPPSEPVCLFLGFVVFLLFAALGGILTYRGASPVTLSIFTGTGLGFAFVFFCFPLWIIILVALLAGAAILYSSRGQGGT